MKTEVRKEHGDWIVFVDDNPQFSFMYREESEKVRNLIDALILVMGICKDYKQPEDIGNVLHENIGTITKALKDIGAI